MTSFVLGKKGITDSLHVGNKTQGGGGLGKIIESSDLPNVIRPSQRQVTSNRYRKKRNMQSTPSVSFSDLDTFANPDRVLPRQPDDIIYNEQFDQGLAYDDQQDEDYYEDNEPFYPADPAVNTPVHADPVDISTAVKHATTAQPTQSFDFIGGQGDNIDTESRSIQTERIHLLAKLKRRNSRRKPHEQEHINPNAHINDLRIQAAGASYETKAKTAVLMLRRITMFIAKVIETVSSKYPEYLPELEGWSENVYLSLDSYDEMLYDIYDEYGHRVKSNPIITFIFALGSNAAMFAMTKKIMSNPITGHVMNNLAKQFSASNSTHAEPPPVKTGDPTVPISTSSTRDVMEEPASFDLQGMLGGNNDIGKLLGGLDMNKLLAGLGDAMGPPPGDVREINVEPIVNRMKPMSSQNQKDVMEMMRTHEDNITSNRVGSISTLKTIHEDEPSARMVEISNERDEKKLVFS